VKSGPSKASVLAREYASEADFCQLFRDEMNRFYFLSLVLTADAKKAEQCFVESLEICMQSRRIFKNWTHRWAIHTIIKTAIRMVSPTQQHALVEMPASDQLADQSAPEALLAALQSVPPLDRFVHHMTVVERYSDLECSTFLGCTPKDVRESRERALQRLATNETLSRMVAEFDAVVATEFLRSFAAKAS
jgi:DNA-directed RNA polymerase specialized sigma24 family protein